MLYCAAMLGRWRRRGRSEGDAQEEEGGAADEPVGALVGEGRLVRLRAHVPANRAAFQRWYADPEIAGLLRHDQEPLNPSQSRGYFDTFILPLSARGMCFAIHEAATDRLIGTTALTDTTTSAAGVRSTMFRIVIGEKDVWGRGYGTEATSMVMAHAFGPLGLGEVRLEVFRHNPRALATYRRVGFRVTGEHVEWVGRKRLELHVVEMALTRDEFLQAGPPADDSAGTGDAESERPRRSPEERAQRKERRQERAPRRERREEREKRREQREERRQRREQRVGGEEAGDVSPSPS